MTAGPDARGGTSHSPNIAMLGAMLALAGVPLAIPGEGSFVHGDAQAAPLTVPGQQIPRIRLGRVTISPSGKITATGGVTYTPPIAVGHSGVDNARVGFTVEHLDKQSDWYNLLDAEAGIDLGGASKPADKPTADWFKNPAGQTTVPAQVWINPPPSGTEKVELFAADNVTNNRTERNPGVTATVTDLGGFTIEVAKGAVTITTTSAPKGHQNSVPEAYTPKKFADKFKSGETSSELN